MAERSDETLPDDENVESIVKDFEFLDIQSNEPINEGERLWTFKEYLEHLKVPMEDSLVPQIASDEEENRIIQEELERMSEEKDKRAIQERLERLSEEKDKIKSVFTSKISELLYGYKYFPNHETMSDVLYMIQRKLIPLKEAISVIIDRIEYTDFGDSIHACEVLGYCMKFGDELIHNEVCAMSNVNRLVEILSKTKDQNIQKEMLYLLECWYLRFKGTAKSEAYMTIREKLMDSYAFPLFHQQDLLDEFKEFKNDTKIMSLRNLLNDPIGNRCHRCRRDSKWLQTNPFTGHLICEDCTPKQTKLMQLLTPFAICPTPRREQNFFGLPLIPSRPTFYYNYTNKKIKQEVVNDKLLTDPEEKLPSAKVSDDYYKESNPPIKRSNLPTQDVKDLRLQTDHNLDELPEEMHLQTTFQLSSGDKKSVIHDDELTLVSGESTKDIARNEN